jgi:hypothetical protein
MSSNFRRFFAAAALLALGAFFHGSSAAAATVDLEREAAIPTGGADLHIHNKTGSDVELYIFEDDTVHKSRAGGLHAGDLKKGETGTAHVKACHFAVVLFHGNDAYHAEFKDCSITDITISAANK